MAVKYLYPIPQPIYIPPQLPPGFVMDAELEAQLRASATSFEAFVRALGHHQIFTRPKGQEQWDAVLLALDERRGRLESAPELPDYFGVTGAALEVLKTCVSDPVFYIMVDDKPSWQRGLPFLPGAVRAFRPFIDLVLRGAKDKKPEAPKLEAVPEAVSEALRDVS